MMSRKIYDQNPQGVDPPMFIGTSYDKASEAWTRSSPNSLVSIVPQSSIRARGGVNRVRVDKADAAQKIIFSIRRIS